MKLSGGTISQIGSRQGGERGSPRVPAHQAHRYMPVRISSDAPSSTTSRVSAANCALRTAARRVFFSAIGAPGLSRTPGRAPCRYAPTPISPASAPAALPTQTADHTPSMLIPAAPQTTSDRPQESAARAAEVVGSVHGARRCCTRHGGHRVLAQRGCRAHLLLGPTHRTTEAAPRRPSGTRAAVCLPPQALILAGRRRPPAALHVSTPCCRRSRFLRSEEVAVRS